MSFFLTGSSGLLIELRDVRLQRCGLVRTCIDELGNGDATVEEILEGSGLPERGLLQFSQEDEAAYNEERPLRPLQKLINFVLGR